MSQEFWVGGRWCGRNGYRKVCTKWAGSGKRKGGRGIRPKPWVAELPMKRSDAETEVG